MSATANHPRATSHRAPRSGTRPGRYFLRWAWVSVATIPIGFALGMLVGEGLLALEGYGSGSQQSVPVGPMLVAAVPALLLLDDDWPLVAAGIPAHALAVANGSRPEGRFPRAAPRWTRRPSAAAKP